MSVFWGMVMMRVVAVMLNGDDGFWCVFCFEISSVAHLFPRCLSC